MSTYLTEYKKFNSKFHEYIKDSNKELWTEVGTIKNLRKFFDILFNFEFCQLLESYQEERIRTIDKDLLVCQETRQTKESKFKQRNQTNNFFTFLLINQ